MTRRRNTRIHARRRGIAAVAVATLAFAPLVSTTGSALGASGSGAVALQPHASVAPERATTAAGSSGHARVVTLVTGDRVLVRSLDGGRSAASLLKGSPSAGRRVDVLDTGTDTYVIPDLTMRQHRRLDLSLFDITRLTALSSGGRIPLVLRFRAGVTPHRLPGVRVDTGSAKRLGSGQTQVHASYASTAAGLAPRLGRAWHGVASARLPGTTPRHTDKDFVLHTLTVKVVNGTKAVPFADVWVQNLDNGRLFGSDVIVVKGRGKLSVPEGNYALIGSTFRAGLAINPQLSVTGNTTVTLDMASATAKPMATVAGTKPIDAAVTLSVMSQVKGGIIWTTESNRWSTKLTPVAPTQPVGTVNTLVGSTLVPVAAVHARRPGKLIYTKDILAGVPDDPTITHTKSDFAVVQHRYFANGPTSMPLFVFGFTRLEFFAFITGIDSRVPSTRELWLEGGDDLSWLQSVDAFVTFGPFRVGEMDAKIRSYDPGSSDTIDFLRGPVGPGLERGLNADTTGRLCLACRVGDELRLNVPLWNSAGTDQIGFLFGKGASRWTLYGGRHRIAQGQGAIFTNQTVDPDEVRYTLFGESKPQSAIWKLSSDVLDEWQFTSANGTGTIPLLMASYRPTTSLTQTRSAGPTKFRLDFDNVGPAADRIDHARVMFGTSRKNMHRAQVKRVDANSFTVSYVAPQPTKRHHTISLRISAADARGNSLVEQASDVYDLTATAKAASATTLARSASGPRTRTRASSAQPVSATTPEPWPTTGLPGKPVCRSGGIHRLRCFALIQAAGRQALTKRGEPAGWGATDLRDAYGLDTMGSPSTTVGILLWNDYPNAESDMNKYRRQFGLPACTSASGCFTKLNQEGETDNYPRPDVGASVEMALDLQMVSTACPACHIVLVEARRPTVGALLKAEQTAIDAGATVTNHSFGLQEYTGVKRAAAAYSVPGVTAVASTGDFGYGPASFPASVPDVVAVGGTTLAHAANPTGWRQAAWRFGGSGCSAWFAKPAYQTDTACSMRTAADVSATAADIAIYDTFGLGRDNGWITVGGTSASSPFTAGLIGAAGAGGMKPGDLYADPSLFRDVKRGDNSVFMSCAKSYICTAVPGYDGPTGWGTPRGLGPFVPPPCKAGHARKC